MFYHHFPISQPPTPLLLIVTQSVVSVGYYVQYYRLTSCVYVDTATINNLSTANNPLLWKFKLNFN